jgi:hypothetical protein
MKNRYLIPLSLITATAFYRYLLRPWHLRWGATMVEVNQELPGDEYVPDPKISYTQAITIDAAPARVWPWVVQVGLHRAGWYTLDWIDNLMGAADFYDGKFSASRIIPELQSLKVGDRVAIHPAIAYDVVQVSRNHALVLAGRSNTVNGESFAPGDPLPLHYINTSWAFVLEPLGERRTRMICRNRTDYSHDWPNIISFGLATEGGSLIMQPNMLKGIRARAEGRPVGF